MGGKPSAQRSIPQSMRVWSRDRQATPPVEPSLGRSPIGSLVKPEDELLQISGSHGIAGAKGIPEVRSGPTEALVRNITCVDTHTKIASPQNSLNRHEPAATSGAVIDSDVEAKADKGLEVFSHAHKVRVESLAATSCSAARDLNVTFSHTSHSYYLSLQPEASPSVPMDRTFPSSPQSSSSITSISRELYSVYHEFGAALTELKAHTNNHSNTTIDQRFQDLYERMGPLQSAICRPTLFAQPVFHNTADRHYHGTAQATSSALATTDGIITPDGGGDTHSAA